MTLPDFALRLLSLPPEASTASTGIDMLHAVVIGTTMAGTLWVTLLVVGYLVRRPRTAKGAATPGAAPRSGPHPVREIALAGGILGLFLAFWVVGFVQYIRLRTPPAGALVTYVTAKQWMWKFVYEDGRSSNDELVVPEGKPVELVMTSRDVIHSFYVPAFRLKQDVIPGRYVTLWFQARKTGTFDIFCAEYCGMSHSNMHGSVRVVPAADYAAALDALVEKSPSADLVEEGSVIATRRRCIDCHALEGPSRIGPSWAHLYGSWETMSDGRRLLVDDDYLIRSMLDPNADEVAGYKPVMPSYRGRLGADETAALVAYIRSLRGSAR